MGKSKKLNHLKAIRSVPLEQQLKDEKSVKQRKRFNNNDNEIESQKYIDSKLSRKILNSAKRQKTELEEELGCSGKSGTTAPKLGDNDSDVSEDEFDGDECEDNYDYESIVINEEDEKALELFMSKDCEKRKTLGDLIHQKLKQKESEIETQLTDINVNTDLDTRVVELYKGVKLVLSRYRSGKLPKAFKVIPALANWEQVLEITDPNGWTAAAMFQATRLFTSNLKEKMAQRFYNLVLLPRMRDDIEEFKRLNFHLYQALRKSLFKSGAFFKGIVLPLCESRDCTLREAVIIGSVMAKNHIPLLHSCAAILKIAEMSYSGSNSVFLHILINKKYALPFRVVDSLVYHFLGFANDKRELPVLWHQCLLVFVEHYGGDVSSEQKDALLELLRVQSHHSITPEVRKLLLNSKCRDQEVMDQNE